MTKMNLNLNLVMKNISRRSYCCEVTFIFILFIKKILCQMIVNYLYILYILYIHAYRHNLVEVSKKHDVPLKYIWLSIVP